MCTRLERCCYPSCAVSSNIKGAQIVGRQDITHWGVANGGIRGRSGLTFEFGVDYILFGNPFWNHSPALQTRLQIAPNTRFLVLLMIRCCPLSLSWYLYEYFSGNIHIPDGPLNTNEFLELILSLLQLRQATIRNRQWTLPRQSRFIRRRY